MGLLIDGFCSSGAATVYVDIQNQQTTGALKLYVDLPADPVKRQACMHLAESLQRMGGQLVTPTPGRYLEMDVPAIMLDSRR